MRCRFHLTGRGGFIAILERIEKGLLEFETENRLIQSVWGDFLFQRRGKWPILTLYLSLIRPTRKYQDHPAVIVGLGST